MQTELYSFNDGWNLEISYTCTGSAVLYYVLFEIKIFVHLPGFLSWIFACMQKLFFHAGANCHVADLESKIS